MNKYNRISFVFILINVEIIKTVKNFNFKTIISLGYK
jgi:hypothetical protein